MDRALASHIFATAHGRDLVVLDLHSGQYELFAGLADQVSLSPDGRMLACGDESLLAELAAMALFGPRLAPAPRALPDLPTDTALFRAPTRTDTVDRLWMLGGWIDMIGRYHGRSFADLIKTARARPPASGSSDTSRLARRAAAFDQLSIWIPFQGDCLYRCFMLLRLLGDAAADVDWVFGVRTWPFLAHCWLQSGDLALSDDAGRLVMFSPILAV